MYLIGQQRDIKNISFFSRDSWNVPSLFQSIIMDPFNSAIEVMSYRTVYRHHHFPPLFRSESLTYNLSLPFFIFSTLNSLCLSLSLSSSLFLSLSPLNPTWVIGCVHLRRPHLYPSHSTSTSLYCSLL